MVLYVGTSGFSYPDWIGSFYPKQTKKADMFSFYVQSFNTVEINFSYYRIPSATVFYRLQHKVPDHFRFAVKANQAMTHLREDNQSIFREFRSSLQPLIESGKIGCILAQFPYSFYYNKNNQDYLSFFKEEMGNIPLVVEFRNTYWIKKEVFNFLKKNKIGFCAVDEPPLPGLIPPLAEATSNLGYFRFHGRNKEKWWHHEHAYERYDYLYNEQELKEWVPHIKKIAAQTTDQYIFMNNHYKGKAAKNALMLMKLLGQKIQIVNTADNDQKK